MVMGGVQMRTLRTGCAMAFSATATGAGPWADWYQVLPMDNQTLGLTYAYPSVTYNASPVLFTAAAMLQDDGTTSGTVQSRTAVLQAGSDLLFTVIGYIGNTLATNACAVTVGTTVYVFDAGTVYASQSPPASVDVSNDVLSLKIVERPSAPQSFTLVLANNTGQYNSLPASDANATVTISLGYNGTTVLTHTLYIDTASLVGSSENQTCEISGRSISKYLDMVTTRALIYSGLTISALIAQILSNTPVNYDTLPATSQFSQVIPCMMLQPGDTWATAVNRLSNVYDFDTIDRATPSVTFVEKAAADPSTWSYGQENFGIAWAHNSDQSTYIRVIGASSTTTPVFTDLTDNVAILVSGGERYRHIVDRNLTTSAQTLLRAQLALRDEQQQAQTGVLTVTLNPIHELLDVVTITDARANLSSQAARIVGIDWHVDMQSGEWLQYLHVQLP